MVIISNSSTLITQHNLAHIRLLHVNFHIKNNRSLGLVFFKKNFYENVMIYKYYLSLWYSWLVLSGFVLWFSASFSDQLVNNALVLSFFVIQVSLLFIFLIEIHIFIIFFSIIRKLNFLVQTLCWNIIEFRYDQRLCSSLL